MQTSTGLSFTVKRRAAELIVPAKPTPRELKPLSNIDDQEFLRFHVPFVWFYSGGDDMPNDPAQVIREALAEALVYYYPLAGRLREASDGKLMVDCTAEGVLFIEAKADVTLEDISYSGKDGFLQPPFPCFNELLFDDRASSGVLHCPLLLFQITLLKCGGIVLALRMNHTIADGTSVTQFTNAMGELARGASCPSMLPVWSREKLLSRDPLRVTCTHHEYDQLEGSNIPVDHHNDKVIERSFFFGPAHILAIRRHLQHPFQHCTNFELLSAFLWRCRTIALRFEPNEEFRYLCVANVRSKLNSPLPTGYYGNVIVFPAAISNAGELCKNNIGYAVELIKKAKAEVTEEYLRSVTDLMESHRRPQITLPGSWLVSSNSHIKYLDLNFGWGKPVYAGLASIMLEDNPCVIGAFIKGMNNKSEMGNLLLLCLPEPAMERFTKEIDSVVGNDSTNNDPKL